MINRILACLLLVAALWLLPHRVALAQAMTGCTINSGTGNYQSTFACDTREHAYNQAAAMEATVPSTWTNGYCGGTPTGAYLDVNVPTKGYSWGAATSTGCKKSAGSDSWVTECTAGTSWNDTSHKCALSCPSGAQEDPDNPGTCLTDAKCQARNASLGLGSDNVVRTWTSICQAGCQYQLQNAEHVTGSTGLNAYRGSMYVSGVCGTNDPTDALTPNNTSPKTHPIPEPPKCTPAGAGQTFCIQPDGRQCATASTGRQVCWTPNETGEKTDQNTLQKRCNGTTCPTLPDQLPPPSDTFNKTDSTTTTVTSSTGSSTTTTITNYTTGSGGPAGSGNTGCSSTTTGGCAPNGTASGGGDCDTPPIVSDPALSMVATEAWATRCAVVAGNTVKVTGDIGNCGAAFTVEGADTDANVQKLRGMRAQICGTNPDGHDSTSAVNGSDDGTALRATMGGEQTFAADGLDSTGYGLSRTCPHIDPVVIQGRSFDLNSTALCDWIAVGGQFVLLLASLFSLKVLAGGTKLD